MSLPLIGRPLCRRFAVSGGNKFDGLVWSPAPTGAPLLPVVAAWIGYWFDSITEAGDHYIVLRPGAPAGRRTRRASDGLLKTHSSACSAVASPSFRNAHAPQQVIFAGPDSVGLLVYFKQR
jgi:flavin reductase (DIM6/NTAB) family NADH-FMN oxidoreductase RutF